MMQQQAAVRWSHGLFERRSVRTYTGERLTAEEAGSLRELRPHRLGSAGVRHILLEGPPVDQILKGLVGSYGRIVGAAGLLVFITQERDPGHMAATGYYGQQVLLEATALGLATCWVGGAFRRETAREVLALAEGENILVVSPVGRAAVTAGLRRLHDMSMKLFVPQRGGRKPLEAVVQGELPAEGWLRTALEAGRWAPSSVNLQPWRFAVSGGVVTVSHEPTGRSEDPRTLDCGIAMANFAVAARAAGVSGDWELHPGEQPLGVFRAF